MKLYLARHGEAQNGIDDFSRALSDKGVREVTALATTLKTKGIHIGRALHSGKLRAQQTAEILADNLMPSSTLEAIEGINPEDSPEAFAETLSALPTDTLIVGHLPFMGYMVSLLITGDARRSPENFQAGTIVCLEQDNNGKWKKVWTAHPSST